MYSTIPISSDSSRKFSDIHTNIKNALGNDIRIIIMVYQFKKRARESMRSDNTADFDHRIGQEQREFLLSVVFGEGAYPEEVWERGSDSSDEQRKIFRPLRDRGLLAGGFSSPRPTQEGQRVAYEILTESRIDDYELEKAQSEIVAGNI
ncbi:MULTISPECIES: hypothetical protein [unclassified Haloarcula]|uniref:hypothetical protein n=1 Tax=unclassified Haloarcula TaxID=2624677 RepID=UPI001249227D|nr:MULTISPECIES: hypothetical protein [unclassified Haloarcula]